MVHRANSGFTSDGFGKGFTDCSLGASHCNGRGDRIRTCDLYVPNVALYQAKLRPDSFTKRATKRHGCSIRKQKKPGIGL